MSENSEKPAHGAERNRGMRTVHGKPVEFQDSQGATVYAGPQSSSTFSVVERYCAHCGVWIHLEGVMGPLTFMVEHDHKEEHGTAPAV